MLSLKFIRQQPDQVRRAVTEKNLTLDLDRLLALDRKLRGAKQRLDAFRAQKKHAASAFRDRPVGGSMRAEHSHQARALSAEIAALEKSVKQDQTDLNALLLQVPNIPSDEAPIGPDAGSNRVVRKVGAPPDFGFPLRDHVELMDLNDWGAGGQVAKVCGTRTHSLKGRLAILEQVLLLHAMTKLTGQGFTAVTVPALAREQAFTASGYFPFARDDVFALPRDDLHLSGTAEIILNSLHSGEILGEDRLPLLYAGLSPCFRREAGSAGRDVRGLLRVHQFVKLELFVLCRNDPAESAQWHAQLLTHAEQLLADLALPYQVVECATGDMGPGKFRMHDIETWMPSLAKYRETHSCSSLHDWQARRANLRYRSRDGKVHHLHTLNNTALASPRILAPFLEVHQTPNGRVRLPEKLRGYFDGDVFL
ncbi:MAG: serine--tRNA ligase [Pseudomonadota bacterium]